MKENNGRAARKQLLRKISVVLVVFTCLVGSLYWMELGGSSRRRWRHKKRKAKARTILLEKDNGNRDIEAYTNILESKFHLIELEVVSKALLSSPENAYHGVSGVFCELSFDVHKKDPSSTPMFRDLVAKSKNCEDTKIRVPLQDIANLAREFDINNQHRPNDVEVPKPLNFTAIAFHESRCGSTLVANTMIGMNPKKHRVYSESPPPITALKICGDDYDRCSLEKAARIFKDVIYLMGRTNDPQEERVFFKIQSVGSRHIEVFQKAFPTTPWVFVYRDPVQVMMSHLAYGTRKANCLRSVSFPPPVTQRIAKRHGYQTAHELTPEEFCAAHLATITESALERIQESNGYGHAVNYKQLPQAMYETVFPHYIGITPTQEEVERIIHVSGSYSKGRGEKKKEWHEDSEQKERGASEAIRSAAKKFMLESYEALNALQ